LHTYDPQPPQWWKHESKKMLCCGWLRRFAFTTAVKLAPYLMAEFD
jgi:hypothetical protein